MPMNMNSASIKVMVIPSDPITSRPARWRWETEEMAIRLELRPQPDEAHLLTGIRRPGGPALFEHRGMRELSRVLDEWRRTEL